MPQYCMYRHLAAVSTSFQTSPVAPSGRMITDRTVMSNVFILPLTDGTALLPAMNLTRIIKKRKAETRCPWTCDPHHC
jgi:hypothetical protein